jgi:hypothetical protein
MLPRLFTALAVLTVLCGALPALADDPIIIDGWEFSSWQEYVNSDYFKEAGKRCATPSLTDIEIERGVPGDCSLNNTNVQPEYDPVEVATLQVVVHVITNTSGTQGNISDPMVESQIEIINEDFLALAGTNGEDGNYAALQFELASVDPDGNPTNGITRSANTTWFNDSGQYWNSLAWDTNRYVNVYTNLAGGNLGYVPNLPQGGIVGFNSDRVVILWSAFGRNAPIGAPYNQGRTLTHELGHYLGLYHTFQGGCQPASPPSCYQRGDTICDTNAESGPTWGCPVSQSSCSTPDPYHNYMDYSNDLCMTEFTVEQVNRMRCTLEHYRPDLDPPSAVGVTASIEGRAGFRLHQNRPNPFSPATEISFDLPSSSPITLRVMDVAGRTIRTLDTGTRSQGVHRVAWDGTNERNVPVAAGVYFYRLTTETGSETRRMVKMK